MRKTTVTKSRATADKKPARGGTAALRMMAPRSGMRRDRRILKTSEIIARDIILDISEGGMKAGDSLPPEASMLQHYEVGRASLREALRLLEVQGLVRIRAGAKGGPVVGAATAENLARMLTLYFGLAGATYEDLTDVMLILYPQVAALAASRKLTKAEVQAINDSLEQACGTQIPPPRLGNKTEALNDFHRLLVAVSKNTVWCLLADAVGMVFSDHVMAMTDSREFHETAEADHREIAAAVFAGDAPKASKAMLEHTERMIEFYRSQTPAIFSQLIEWR